MEKNLRIKYKKNMATHFIEFKPNKKKFCYEVLTLWTVAIP
jgi:hypothetical protein